MSRFPLLNDQLLIETYFRSIKLQLDTNFISLLETEIINRNIIETLSNLPIKEVLYLRKNRKRQNLKGSGGRSDYGEGSIWWSDANSYMLIS